MQLKRDLRTEFPEIKADMRDVHMVMDLQIDLQAELQTKLQTKLQEIKVYMRDIHMMMEFMNMRIINGEFLLH